MQDSHVSVNEKIELGDSVHVEMLMDEEQLQLVELEGVLQCMNENFHHVWVHICVVQEPQVDMQSHFESIILDCDNE